MAKPEIVTREQWLEARRAHLAREKALTQLRDAVSRERRALPWVEVDRPYAFEGDDGTFTLAQLFGDKHQLVVYHFMFAPDWEEGCKSCSFWADNFDGVDVHLAARDIAFVMVSRAPLATLRAYKQRMGWRFRWLSCGDGDFNYDFDVSFTGEQLAGAAASYNYREQQVSMSDLPGMSVFCRDDDGRVYHTYSCYARGLDRLNGAYHVMDMVPKGRDEDRYAYPMEWLRRRDQYDAV